MRTRSVYIGMLLVVILGAATAPGWAAAPAPPDMARQASGDTSNMVLVPADYFLMGSTTADFNEAIRLCDVAGVSDCPGYFNDELPARQVYTDAYYIDMYPVTNAEYVQCVAAGACNPPRDFSAYTYPSYYNNPSFSMYPVVHVNWYDANAYCAWRGKRLLTEAEWEKAAHWNPVTNQTTLWPWGDSVEGDRLNLCDQNCSFSGRYPVNDGYADIAPVGSYPNGMSPVGAYDMAGNVWQWVADYYDEDYYTYGSTTNPQGPTTGTERVRRGGAFNNPATFTRSANRTKDDPNTHDHTLGIRCGMDAAGIPPGLPDTGPTALYIGGRATVHVINDTLSVRTGPNVAFTEVERLANGTLVTIEDGPVAGGGYTWWYIRAPSGNRGWAVDYADGIVTLIPYD
ncbi:MAG: formylglycine-generating enzyme family protein [Anaerolineae bacterium]|nr:formylglycine-generating enzyme family protein [Anaerolineae bacterium]